MNAARHRSAAPGRFPHTERGAGKGPDFACYSVALWNIPVGI